MLITVKTPWEKINPYLKNFLISDSYFPLSIFRPSPVKRNCSTASIVFISIHNWRSGQHSFIYQEKRKGKSLGVPPARHLAIPPTHKSRSRFINKGAIYFLELSDIKRKAIDSCFPNEMLLIK